MNKVFVLNWLRLWFAICMLNSQCTVCHYLNWWKQSSAWKSCLCNLYEVLKANINGWLEDEWMNSLRQTNLKDKNIEVWGVPLCTVLERLVFYLQKAKIEQWIWRNCSYFVEAFKIVLIPSISSNKIYTLELRNMGHAWLYIYSDPLILFWLQCVTLEL